MRRRAPPRCTYQALWYHVAEAICELCSLKAEVDIAKCAEFDFDAVICSHGRLTYEQVQTHLDYASALLGVKAGQ